MGVITEQFIACGVRDWNSVDHREKFDRWAKKFAAHRRHSPLAMDSLYSYFRHLVMRSTMNKFSNFC